MESRVAFARPLAVSHRLDWIDGLQGRENPFAHEGGETRPYMGLDSIQR